MKCSIHNINFRRTCPECEKDLTWNTPHDDLGDLDLIFESQKSLMQKVHPLSIIKPKTKEKSMSAFDTIAKPVAAKDSKSTTKIAADLTSDIKFKVDTFVNNKAELKRISAEQAEIETAIIEHVRPQQDKLAYDGTFTKSLQLQGVSNSVTFVTMDKFSVPQDEEAVAAIRKLLNGKFNDLFETKRFISMKKEAVENETILNKVAKACEKAGLSLGEIFEVGDKIVAKDDLDRKQYDLPKTKLAEFRTLVRQAKPALK
jgi:hypothetical protein